MSGGSDAARAARAELVGAFPRPRDWWLLALGLFFLLVIALGSRGLNEPDEGRYANIALAMAHPGGNWWEPRMSGFAHYDKPPLIYWLTALSFRAFGVNEWAARLPSLLGAGLTLLGLGWAAARLYNARVAWWAVLIAGTSVQFWVLARVLSPDMLLTGWCTLGLATWAEGRHRDGAWRFWALSWLCWSLAWWTKATPCLIPLAGLAVGVRVSGDRRGAVALRWWLLLPAILLAGAPWYLSMLHRHPELREFFFGRELAGRLTGRVDGRHGSLLYYVPISALGWLPWWPVAAWAAWRTNKREDAPWWRRLGVEGWIVITGLGLFSLAASKLPTYSLPLAPWAALLIARPIAAQSRQPAPPFFWAWLVPAGVFAVCTGIGISLLPGRESELGFNSSLRDVCRFLHTHNVRQVQADRYWPSLEFYLPRDTVRYIVHNARQQERASDAGLSPELFVDTRTWLKTAPGVAPCDGCWLLHHRKVKHSRFGNLFARDRALGQDARVVRIGGFELLPLGPATAQTGKSADLDDAR